MARPAGLPTAADGLARTRQYVVASEQGANTYAQIDLSNGDLLARFSNNSDDICFDLRGWTGWLHGGTPSSTGSNTDSNKYPLKISDRNAGTKPLRPMLVGAGVNGVEGWTAPTTPANQVGAVKIMRTSVGNRWAIPNPDSLSWDRWKGLKEYLGAVPDLDGDALNLSYNSSPGATWDNNQLGTAGIGLIISGVILEAMDGIALGTGPTGALIEHTWVREAHDDAIENDHSNTPVYLWKCLIDASFSGISTDGTASRGTTQTVIDSSVVILKRRPWRSNTSDTGSCTYAAYDTNADGVKEGCGRIDKRHNNTDSPKIHFTNSVVYIPSPGVGPNNCAASWTDAGFGNSTRCTAANTTFVYGRSPGHPSYPVNPDPTMFFPTGTGVSVVYEDQGGAAILASAVQTWYNEHPWSGLASGGGVGQAAGMLAH